MQAVPDFCGWKAKQLWSSNQDAARDSRECNPFAETKVGSGRQWNAGSSTKSPKCLKWKRRWWPCCTTIATAGLMYMCLWSYTPGFICFAYETLLGENNEAASFRLWSLRFREEGGREVATSSTMVVIKFSYWIVYLTLSKKRVCDIYMDHVYSRHYCASCKGASSDSSYFSVLGYSTSYPMARALQYLYITIYFVWTIDPLEVHVCIN